MSGFWCRIFRLDVNGIAIFIFIFNGRDRLNDFHFAVAAHAGTGRNQLADDDVFLEAEKRIDLALDGCIGKDAGRFLEGSG